MYKNIRSLNSPSLGGRSRTIKRSGRIFTAYLTLTRPPRGECGPSRCLLVWSSREHCDKLRTVQKKSQGKLICSPDHVMHVCVQQQGQTSDRKTGDPPQLPCSGTHRLGAVYCTSGCQYYPRHAAVVPNPSVPGPLNSSGLSFPAGDMP